MRHNDTLLATVLLIQFLCVAVGCGSSSVSSGTVEDSEHHDEHLEHHRPEHRPASFTAAVEQIARRHARIQAKMMKKSDQSLDHEISELLDILVWLPEIAGDSELRQSDWETVKQHAESLASLLQKLDPSGIGVQQDISSIHEMTTLIKDLRKLVPASVRH